MKTARTVAQQRQLDWLLGEVLGDVTAAPRRTGMRAMAAARQPRWFAAALVILAVSAAFGVAWLRSEDAAKQAHQPQGEPEWRECRDPRDLDAMPLDVRALRCFDFDDAAMAGLAKLERLERLDLSGMDVNDQGYAVSLKITDTGLAHLGKLTNLRWLSLASCEQVKGDGLIVLENLPRLEHLDVTYTQMGSPAIERLQRLPSLRELVLSSCMHFHGRSLAAIARIPGLRRLELRGCTTVSGGDVAQLAALRALRWLDLSDCQGRFRGRTLSTGEPEPDDKPKEDGIGVTDVSIAALGDLKLETLLLDGCESLTDAIGDTLAKMSTLRRLDLSGLPKVTGALLAKVPPSLESLAIRENRQFDSLALLRLPKLPQLRAFSLSGLPALDDGTLRVLLEGKRLQSLGLGGSEPRGMGYEHVPYAMTPAAAEFVAAQKGLTELSLRQAIWYDADALAQLATLPELHTLDLTARLENPLRDTSEVVVGLRGNRSIQTLRMMWCRLTTAALLELRDLPLRELDLCGTNLKPAEVKDAVKAWPGCTVKLPDGQRFVAPK